MAEKKNLDKLNELASGNASNWLEKANWRKENEAWLDLSFKIALKILRVLRERQMTQKDLADQMMVTPQYINKVLKGTENLSLETISNLSKVLAIDLLATLSEYQASIDEWGTILVGELTMKYASFTGAEIVAVKPDAQPLTVVLTPYVSSAKYSEDTTWCELKAA